MSAGAVRQVGWLDDHELHPHAAPQRYEHRLAALGRRLQRRPVILGVHRDAVDRHEAVPLLDTCRGRRAARPHGRHHPVPRAVSGVHYGANPIKCHSRRRKPHRFLTDRRAFGVRHDSAAGNPAAVAQHAVAHQIARHPGVVHLPELLRRGDVLAAPFQQDVAAAQRRLRVKRRRVDVLDQHTPLNHEPLTDGVVEIRHLEAAAHLFHLQSLDQPQHARGADDPRSRRRCVRNAEQRPVQIHHRRQRGCLRHLHRHHEVAGRHVALFRHRHEIAGGNGRLALRRQGHRPDVRPGRHHPRIRERERRQRRAGHLEQRKSNVGIPAPQAERTEHRLVTAGGRRVRQAGSPLGREQLERRRRRRQHEPRADHDRRRSRRADGSQVGVRPLGKLRPVVGKVGQRGLVEVGPHERPRPLHPEGVWNRRRPIRRRTGAALQRTLHQDGPGGHDQEHRKQQLPPAQQANDREPQQRPHRPQVSNSTSVGTTRNAIAFITRPCLIISTIGTRPEA